MKTRFFLCSLNILLVFDSIARLRIFVYSLRINIFVFKDPKLEQYSFLNTFPTFSSLPQTEVTSGTQGEI